MIIPDTFRVETKRTHRRRQGTESFTESSWLILDRARHCACVGSFALSARIASVSAPWVEMRPLFAPPCSWNSRVSFPQQTRKPVFSNARGECLSLRRKAAKWTARPVGPRCAKRAQREGVFGVEQSKSPKRTVSRKGEMTVPIPPLQPSHFPRRSSSSTCIIVDMNNWQEPESADQAFRESLFGLGLGETKSEKWGQKNDLK
jgi:hypothetical protein